MMAPRVLSGWAEPAAILGGALWVPHAVFEMLRPWGAAMVYQEERGYDLITNTALFVAYGLPGSLAQLLTSLGLLGIAARLGLPVRRTGKAGLIVANVAVGLGVLSLLGVIVLVAALFAAGLAFGSVFVGAAAFLLGLDAWRTGVASRWAVALLILGLIGLFMLPLRPLVYAVELVPPAAGAAFIGLFGLAWISVGFALRR
ncbi:MAG: hypothetical protein HW416_3649 [Chloroflexi bacterium]|nr:hypothetical protein [Chloroflexota bacterium]